MCGCPPHLIEIAAQTASNFGSLGPFAGLIFAALAGGKFGQFVLKTCGFKALAIEDTPEEVHETTTG